ncbi:MAG TPA: hypothetical protein VKC54_01830 [Patescibacteria group bacterium]|nr:hypothetical protein [Patescibacteria group bacterium]
MERKSFASKIDVAIAGLANVAREAAPYFANYGMTDNAMVVAGILVAAGDPVLPALVAIASLDYIRRDIKSNKPLLI